MVLNFRFAYIECTYKYHLGHLALTVVLLPKWLQN